MNSTSKLRNNFKLMGNCFSKTEYKLFSSGIANVKENKFTGL